MQHALHPMNSLAGKSALALLLEDEPLIAIDLEQMLKAAGFQVATVMSCAEAEEWLAAQKPDIVIVDILLRDGPADKVVERLVDADIPFVVHSGDHPSQHAGTPFEHGSWISKPASEEDLIGVARTLISL